LYLTKLTPALSVASVNQTQLMIRMGSDEGFVVIAIYFDQSTFQNQNHRDNY